MGTSPESVATKQDSQAARTKLELQGKISKREMLHVELDSGVSVTAPEGVLFRPGALGTIGDIIDIACKLTGWCGGGGGGGTRNPGDGCTTITITNPDGSSTTIKSCPPTSIA